MSGTTPYPVELHLSEDAALSPYIGDQLSAAGWGNHQDNLVHKVSDPAAQAWADQFDWLADARVWFKRELAARVTALLTHTTDHDIMHRIALHAAAAPLHEFHVPRPGGGYATFSAAQVTAEWSARQAWEQRVHAFARSLGDRADAATSMADLVAVRDAELHGENWPT